MHLMLDVTYWEMGKPNQMFEIFKLWASAKNQTQLHKESEKKKKPTAAPNHPPTTTTT